ncbi:MAG: GNAT family N-acetyltransferase [Tsuneonella sp.]
MSESRVPDSETTIRAFRSSDRAALERFVVDLPAHDLLFLARDLRHPKVIEAWVDGVEAGEIASFVALDGDRVIATTANIRDPLSWSRHVCEIRLLVLPEARRHGIGRALLDRAVQRALADGATKLVARRTPDQVGAITLFEESGFRGEALLASHVRDDEGRSHDLAILALDPAREAAKLAAFGE